MLTRSFELWEANWVLGALIWYPVIKNMDQYMADLTIAIDNVLDRWEIVDPTRITHKYKLHVLPHAPEGCSRDNVDPDRPEVAEAFYGHLFRNADATSTPPVFPDLTESAEGLHLAMRKLRTRVPFARWVPFVHYGL
ncbi:hypothetical protein B0H14DRAFT_2556192 [Mycena olivaceomarginata]|nr:hypothetical protein B0H14DRAFT_2556192 [Mycena olivaceomarginata]